MNKFFDKPFSEMPSVETMGGGLLKTRGDKYIWGIVVFLALTSLLVVYSATGSLAYKLYKGNTEVYLLKQFAFILVGMAVIYFAHRINYTLYSRVALYLFLGAIPLLIYTLFFGAKINEELWERCRKSGGMHLQACLATCFEILGIALVVSAHDDVRGNSAATIHLKLTGYVVSRGSNFSFVPALNQPLHVRAVRNQDLSVICPGPRRF